MTNATEPLGLNGRTAVVTGAASGIGRALAFEAANRGMSVCLADIAAEGAVEAFAAECFVRFVSLEAAI